MQRFLELYYKQKQIIYIFDVAQNFFEINYCDIKSLKYNLLEDLMKEILDIIKKFILENIDCDAIVLFGSYARGTQNAESDIDIDVSSAIKFIFIK